MDSGSIAWVLASSALVLLMTPGLALFYGGMVRAKNMLGMLMMNFYCLGIVPIVWVFVGYTLAFGDVGEAGLIGNFDFAALKDTQGEALLFVVFQLTFAVITPALISGAVADRMKFAAWAVFVPIWSIVVYSPVAAWVFNFGDNQGWLVDLGSLDFAGGAVVHMNAGAAALALIIVLGKRKGWPDDVGAPHSLPLTMLGTGLLWFGWFGFNAGSAFGANAVAIEAFANTFFAASAAMMGWVGAEWIKDGKPTTLGAASGAVAGLVAITPCAGFVGGTAGIWIGLIAGVMCYLAIQLKFRFKFDDSLDVIGIHLVGGLVGTLLLGLFADGTVVRGNPDGLFFGGGSGLIADQAVAAAATIAFSFVVTFIIAKAIDATIGLRVSEDDEAQGLDLSQHAENAYSLGELGGMGRVG